VRYTQVFSSARFIFISFVLFDDLSAAWWWIRFQIVNFIWELCLCWQFALPVYRMLSINVLLQSHVFNSSFYFLSLVIAKKKGKKIIPIFHSKIKGERYILYDCVLYSNKYGKWFLLKYGQIFHFTTW